jgi:hypothetical protein
MVYKSQSLFPYITLMFLLSYANDASSLKQIELGSTSTRYPPSRRLFTRTTSLNHLGL